MYSEYTSGSSFKLLLILGLMIRGLLFGYVLGWLLVFVIHCCFVFVSRQESLS